MLTIRAMSDGTGYAGRHLEHNDYYDEANRVQGQWYGHGAEMLGLEGAVTSEQFEAVRQGLDPSTGEFLRQRHSADRIAANGTTESKARTLYDFTVSAPKSVSILAGPGGDLRLAEAHDRAFREAVKEVESCAGARVRRNGANHDRTTDNMVIAAYRHDTSRELDPQLHTHAVAANMTYDGEEGRWKALQSTGIYERCAYLTEVYRNALAREVIALGYEVEARRVKGEDCGFQIKGVSQDLLDKYSQRSQQRDRDVKEFTRKQGRAPTDNEVAVLVREARSDKLMEVSTEEVKSQQRARLTVEEARTLGELRQGALERQGQGLRQDVSPSLGHAKEHVFERVSVSLRRRGRARHRLHRHRRRDLRPRQRRECPRLGQPPAGSSLLPHRRELHWPRGRLHLLARYRAGPPLPRRVRTGGGAYGLPPPRTGECRPPPRRHPRRHRQPRYPGAHPAQDLPYHPRPELPPPDLLRVRRRQGVPPPMSTLTDTTGTRSLLDSIAALLKPEQREYFYRRMAHFENLSPEDDMLRIFEAMGFLTFILRDAPAEMTIEREKLAQLLAINLTHMQAAVRATATYHEKIEARLSQLPAEIAKGLDPAAIATRIGESLRQQLQNAGLQETANDIRAVSSQMTATATGMQKTLAAVSDPHSGVFPRVDAALSRMETNLGQAVNHTADLSTKLYRQARPTLPWVVVAALLLVICGLIYRWPTASPQASTAPPPPTVSQLPPKTTQLLATIQQQQQTLRELQQRLQDTEAQLAYAQAAAGTSRRYPPLR